MHKETSQVDGKDIEAMGIIQWVLNQPVHHGQLVVQILREALKGRRNIAILPKSSAFCLSSIRLAWKREAQVDEDRLLSEAFHQRFTYFMSDGSYFPKPLYAEIVGNALLLPDLLCDAWPADL